MRRRLARDETGAAAAEMALLVPLAVLLLFGAFETGHFVWTQHKLVEAVRDGARFAGRLPADEVCPPTGAMTEEIEDEIKLITRTGQLQNSSTDDECSGSGGARPKICGWTDLQIELECGTFTEAGEGIYSQLGTAGPVIKVKASGVTYPSLFHGLGIIAAPQLSAESNAPVIGI